MQDGIKPSKRSIAYFSMEIALESALPSYSGGLGVLAGDTIRAAADMGLPMVGLSLLYRKGYFRQELGEDGTQVEHAVAWRVEDFLKEEESRASLSIEGRRVWLRCWRYDVKGVRGDGVPVYFLDADLPENSDFDRGLTGSLYGGGTLFPPCHGGLPGGGGRRPPRAVGATRLRRCPKNRRAARVVWLAPPAQ